MHDLKACLVCLRTNVKLFNMSLDQFRKEFNTVSGLKTHSGDGLPEYICMECLVLTKRFKKFRDKCHRSHYILHEILHKNKQITKPILEEINLSKLMVNSTLSYLDFHNGRNKFENIKFQWVSENRPQTKPLHLPLLQFSTNDESIIYNAYDSKEELEESVINHENVKEEVNISNIFKPCEDDSDILKNVQENNNVVSDNDDNNEDDEFKNDDNCEIGNEADGLNLDEEYAVMIPITMNESKAVVDVYKTVGQGKLKCKVCGKGYQNEKRLEVHLRMHDTHISGQYFCELCHYYYKTNFLLKTHMTEKHLFKYVCRKCPEVNFDRTSAKQHYIWTHLQKGSKKDANWYDSRPKWLKKKVPNKQKSVLCMRPIKKLKKLPSDYLKYAPISQEEQYALVQERRNTKNYTDSAFKCELCYKGFREATTYNNHMKKHDPKISGKYQCDACKICCVDTRKMYKHMNLTHLFKYTCQMCSFMCYNRNQATSHYKWHKNVTYTCPHCDKVYKKASTRLTHIRIKHPSTYICNICGHSFVSETGLYCHKKLAHTKEEIEELVSSAAADDPLYCAECDLRFRDYAAYSTHFGSSSKHAATNLSSVKGGKGRGSRARPGRRPRRNFTEVFNTGLPMSTNCEICNKFLSNDRQAREHYDTEHPDSDFPKRYMCDICGHTTRQYSNLMVHMRTHTREKPYECPHCERRFSMPSNRDRHLVVHTGEKRYECKHCNRRFTQSSAVKLHIQTVHLKIPYAPWDKNNRKRRKEAELVSSVPAPRAPAHEVAHDYLDAYITYNE